jgi:hypothetical protein
MPAAIPYAHFKHVRSLCKRALGLDAFGASDKVVEKYVTTHGRQIFARTLSADEQALAKAGTLPDWLTAAKCKELMNQIDAGLFGHPSTPPFKTSSVACSPASTTSQAASSHEKPESCEAPVKSAGEGSELADSSKGSRNMSARAYDKFIKVKLVDINVRVKQMRERRLHVRKTGQQLVRLVASKMWAKLDKAERAHYRSLCETESPSDCKGKKRDALGCILKLLRARPQLSNAYFQTCKILPVNQSSCILVFACVSRHTHNNLDTREVPILNVSWLTTKFYVGRLSACLSHGSRPLLLIMSTPTLVTQDFARPLWQTLARPS